MQNTDKTSNKVHFERRGPAETAVLWLECLCVFPGSNESGETIPTDAVLCCYCEIHDRCLIMSASLLLITGLIGI